MESLSAPIPLLLFIPSDILNSMRCEEELNRIEAVVTHPKKEKVKPQHPPFC